MLIIRTILFTLLVPGAVVGLFPYLLSGRWPEQLDIGLFRYTGFVFIMVGVIFYVASTMKFMTEGKGTPAIWFTKPIRFLIGEAPRSLVPHGLYRFTRNPMYLGVIATVLGEAIWLEKTILLYYTAFIMLFFHLIVVFVEEPHLRKLHGHGYLAYCRTVPRWIGARRKTT